MTMKMDTLFMSRQRHFLRLLVYDEPLAQLFAELPAGRQRLLLPERGQLRAGVGFNHGGTRIAPLGQCGPPGFRIGGELGRGCRCALRRLCGFGGLREST